MNVHLFRRLLLYTVGFLLFGLAPATLAATPVSSVSAEADRPHYVPAETRVALLPVINQSGEKDRKQRSDQTASGQKEMENQFRSRNFQIVDNATLQKALTDLKIDLTDDENQNRAILYRIGEAVNADIVTFVVITNVDQKRVQRPFGDDDHQLESRANIKIWLLDVKRQQALLSAFRQEAQAKNILFASFDSGARLIRKAVEGAVRDSLKETMTPYPVVQK